MIKGVIFDFDGTLFDSMEIWDHIAIDYLKTKGIDDDSITGAVSNLSMKDALIYMKNLYRIHDNLDVMYQDVQDLLYNYYAYNVIPKKGVIDFLNYLHNKNIQIFILSASTRKLIEIALEHYQIRDYFNDIFCCDELQLDKNSHDIFLWTLKKINLNKNEVLMFEDAYHAIKMAKELGIEVIGIADKSEKRDVQSLVDLYIDNYKEAEDYINEKSFNNCWE